MLVGLHRNLGEVLHLGAVLAHMLDAGLAEHGGHEARAHLAFGRVCGIAATRTAQQALFAHLLDANRHRDVIHAGSYRHVCFAKRGRAGRACVGHIDDGNAGLANLLQDALTNHRVGLIQIAAREHLDIFDRDARVLHCDKSRFAAEFRNCLLGVTPELDHPGTEHVDITHFKTSWRPGATPRSVDNWYGCWAELTFFTCWACTETPPHRGLRDPSRRPT